MKKLLTLVSICLGLAVGTALAETLGSDQVVKTEIGSDISTVPVFDLFYVAEATQEVVPDFEVPMLTGKEMEGFKNKVYHPPTINRRNSDNQIRRL